MVSICIIRNTGTVVALFVAGAVLGAFYFYALWQTVKRLPVATNPVRLMIGGYVVRILMALAVYYFVIISGNWELLISFIAGFLLIKLVLVRYLGTYKTT